MYLHYILQKQVNLRTRDISSLSLVLSKYPDSCVKGKEIQWQKMKKFKGHFLFTFPFPNCKAADYLLVPVFQKSQKRRYKHKIEDLRTRKPAFVPSHKINVRGDLLMIS